MEAGIVVKGQGKPNDLLDRIAADPAFAPIHAKLGDMLDPKLFVGRAPQQVDDYCAEVQLVLDQHPDLLAVENTDAVNV